METQAFQKIYTKIDQITKATITLHATGVGNEEIALVNDRLAQVVKIIGDEVTLQVFGGTEGIPTNAEVIFFGRSANLKVGDELSGRFFNAYGEPIDGGPEVEGEEVEIGGPTVNPVRRLQPSEFIPTGIAGIDLNNALVTGQKIPFFADPDQPYNQVMSMVALRAKADKIILGGMGLTTLVRWTASSALSTPPRTPPWSVCWCPTCAFRLPSTLPWRRTRKCWCCSPT
jgi:V/A-type H+-transporting ATPase subunit B